MTTKNFKDIDHTVDTTPETSSETPRKSSGKLSKAKTLITTGLTAAMIGLANNADAQIHDLGITPDGRFSVLLTDMGQERVYWDETGGKAQGMGIYYIDPDTGENVWIFGTQNNDIIINEVNGEIINTTVDGRQARKFVFDPLPEGREYIISTNIRTSDLQYPNGDSTYTTLTYTERQGSNTQVNEIWTDATQSTDPDITKQFWGNRIGADEEAIQVVPSENGTMITIPIPAMKDGSNDTSLDASNLQTETLVGVRSSTGQEEILSGDDITRGDHIISVTTTLTDIKEMRYQHPATGKTVLNYMDIVEQTAPQPQIKIAPNPIKTGQVLQLQTPNGVQISNYEIFDLTGKKVVGGKRQANTDITSFLPQGQYIIRVFDQNSKVIGVQRLLKQ